MPDPSSVAGKTFLLVGGTTGLGLSAARALVSRGANLYLVGRSQQSLDSALADLGGAASGSTGDAADPDTAPKAIADAVARFGAIDGLYHVAGGSGRSAGDGPLHELTDEGWRFTVDLNLSSIVYSNRAAVRYFREQSRPGAILNMGSVLGSSPSPQYFSTHGYAATKSAVIGFTKSIAACYAPDGIRANVIAPALVETPMSERAQGNDEIRAFICTKQPLEGGRIGLPEDLDEAVVFLLGDGSRYMTGQVVTVDGGWSISEGQIEGADS